MKKIYTLIFCLTIVSAAIYPQSAGNTGLSFLKIGFGARNIAMGDVGAETSNDVTALYYNPARLAGNNSSEIMVMHNAWIQGISNELLGAKTSLFGLPFAFGFNVTNVDNIEVRTKPGNPESTFNANFFFGSISTGFFITKDIAFGLSGKYIYQGIFVDEETGWGMDLGLNYFTSLDGLTVSAVVRNIGSMSKLRFEKTKLPTDIRFGPAYKFSLPDQKLNIVVGGEYQKYFATQDNHLDFGAEIWYNNVIAIRGGYLTGYISKGFTAGIGLHWGSLSFDYALTPFSYDLGTGNSLSLNFVF